LYCENKDLRTVISSLSYIGNVIGLLLFNWLADNNGRKLAFTISIGIGTIGLFLFTLGPHLVVVSMGCFLFGFGI